MTTHDNTTEQQYHRAPSTASSSAPSSELPGLRYSGYFMYEKR